MSSSVGMMTFPIYGKIKKMFQTTNQLSKHQIFTSIDYGHSVQRWTACEHLGKTAPDRFIRDPTRIRWQWLGVRGQKSNTAVVIHGVLSKTRNFLRAAATGRHGGWRNEHLYNYHHHHHDHHHQYQYQKNHHQHQHAALTNIINTYCLLMLLF